MEQHHDTLAQRESEPGCEGAAPAASVLSILRRYSAGDISAREAARAMGPAASEHDVFAGVVAAGLRLPEPSEAETAREMAALRVLYGSRDPHTPSKVSA